ncbi:MAG: hypothetical protein ACFFFG_05755 [Candidatus Thorarchaeota archaeon]
MVVKYPFFRIFLLLVLFVTIGCNLYWFNTIQKIKALEVTSETIVEENDVVILNYTLWVDNAIDDIQNGTVYVHDPSDSTVPVELYERFPDIHTPPNVGFMETLIGMRANETKTVTIPAFSPKGFTNTSDRLYGKQLFYQIYLREILVDSTSLPFTLFDIPFFIPLMIVVLIVPVAVIYYRIRRFTSTRDLLGRKARCLSCGAFAEVRCGNVGCLSPYCKQCFIDNHGCTMCNSNSMVPLKQ